MPNDEHPDMIQVEVEAEELASYLEFSISGGPKISGSLKLQARTIKVVVIGFCILWTLSVTLLGILSYLLAG